MTYTVEIPEGGNAKAFEAFVKAMNFPFRKAKSKAEKPYNPEFVAKIEESRQQYRNGKFTVIETEDLWK